MANEHANSIFGDDSGMAPNCNRKMEKHKAERFKDTPGYHVWDARRSLTPENRIAEVRVCVKCHLMEEFQRGVTQDDINEEILRVRSVKQRIDAKKADLDKEMEREKAQLLRFITGFCQSEG